MEELNKGRELEEELGQLKLVPGDWVECKFYLLGEEGGRRLSTNSINGEKKESREKI